MVEEVPGGPASREPGGNEAEELHVTRPNAFSATIKWRVNWNQAKLRQKCVQSKYVEVGGKDCRLLVYPSGDTQALPGYVSFYLQLQDPNMISNHRWECFASYTLAVLNATDHGADLARESWHRFSSKPSRQQTRPLSSSSHGWADFTSAAQILDPKAGFLVNGCITVSATVLVLEESMQFTRDTDSSTAAGEESLSGKFTWRVNNFGLFRDMIRVQKIMSPPFPAGDCSLRISVYQSTVGGKEHLSLCLESKDLEATAAEAERTCWCLFRLGITNSKEGSKPFTRESFGRFSTDLKQTDSASLGWNDFMSMDTFTDAAQGYLKDGAAVFQASFQALKEASSVHKACPFRELAFNGRQAPRRIAGPQAKAGSKVASSATADSHHATFVWRIEHFSRLKDVLKKRKITGLCVKSRRFLVGGYTCRLIIYPRGQSQPPQHLSMFLEVSDSQGSSGWSCFVSHRLAVVNQRDASRSLAKESQNRYMKSAKDWGWREFITLQALFDADAGHLLNDDCVFAAEVLMLRESSEAHQMLASELAGIEPSRALMAPPTADAELAAAASTGEEVRFTWRLENFAAFRSILETRKVFSRFFAAEGCKLRVGAYTSLNTLCTYLESDVSAEGQAERNFWVKSRVAVLNQRHPERTIWKESAICTKTWNSSVLQLIDLTELMDPESGFLGREGLILRVDVLECCPWFEFADLETYASDQEGAMDVSTDAYSDSVSAASSSESSHSGEGGEDSYFWQMLTFGFTEEWEDMTVDDAKSATSLIADDLDTYQDDSLVETFLGGLQEFLDSPARLKLLLQPLKGQDPANRRPLCLLDVLSGLKPIREGVIHTILSALVDISCPEAIAVPEPEGAQSMAKQLEASEPGIEALKPPMAEPKAGKSTTEGSAQQSMQRKGRIERRHQQLRAKQRLRPGAAGGEAARARSSSSASTAFTPEGQSHLVKDERRQVSEDAACSTAKIGEESPLRPAGVRGSSSAGVKALTDSSGAAMECSSDPECDASSGEAIEEVIDVNPGDEPHNPSSRQLRALARKLSRAEPGLKLSGATLKQASDLISQATAKIEAQMRSGVMDPSVLNGLSQDTDFNALLQDIASGPAPVHDLRTGKHEGLEDAPDEATGSQPSSEGEKDTMADSASEDVAAASLSAERKSLRQRFNPMRGFLSRRPSSATSSQGGHCSAAAADTLEISKPSAAQQTSRAVESTKKGMLGLSALPDRSTPASELGADGQQAVELPSEATPEAQAASNNSEDTQGVKQSSESLELAESQCPAGDVCPENAGSSIFGQDGSPEHEAAVLNLSLPGQQQPGSPISPASSEEALSLGLQWLQSMYSGPADVAVGFPQVQDSLQDFKSLLSGLPPHLQAELVLMSPSMVSESLHSELAPVLALGILGQPGATGQTGSDGEPYGFGEPARIPALAAMCQIRPTQPDACASTLGALCMVVEEAKPEELPWCAMAILHIMAVPASDADTSNAALALLDACSACPDSVVQTALRGALHAAMQRQPRCAGLLLAGCKAHLKDPDGGTPAKRQLLAYVLLECMQQPQLRSEACSQLLRGIADGHFGSSEMSAAIQACASAPAMPPASLSCGSIPCNPDSCLQHELSTPQTSVPDLQQLWQRLIGCEGGRDHQHIIWLGERMLSCHDKAVQSCASTVFACAARYFRSKETETRIVASLVEKAMAGTAAAAPASAATSAQHSKAQRRKGGAPAPAPGSQAPGVGQSTSADAEAARQALMAVMGEAEGCAQLALALLLQKARAPAKEVDRLSQQLQKLEGDLEAAKSAEASARSKAAAEAKQRALAAAEAEAAGANARQEHSQATSRLSASLKKLEGRCEQLEKETDWAKAERDEASKAAEAAAERVRELEAAAGRQKGQRRDDTKKAVKEGRAATQRAEAAEAGKRKTEEELRRVRAEALTSAEHATAQLAASKALASAAEAGLAAKTTQAGQLARKVEELEGKLAASARHSEHLSAAIGKEQQKVRFFFGHDLQQLSRENLEQLEAFHHSSLAKIQSRLAEKRQHALDEAEQRAAAEAAAVTAAVAESVVGSPRAPSGSATPSLPHTPSASTGGLTPRDARATPRSGLGLGSTGSVDSTASLDSARPEQASSAGLFALSMPMATPGSGPGGALPNASGLHSMGIGLSAPPASPASTAGHSARRPASSARSPVPAGLDPQVSLPSRPAGSGSNAPGGRLGPLRSPFRIARGESPPAAAADAAASLMGAPSARHGSAPRTQGMPSPATASKAPGVAQHGERAQRDVRVRLENGHSSSAANLQAAFSGLPAAPAQLQQRSGSDSVTFPRMFGAAPDLKGPQHGLPPGSSGLFGPGPSTFATTLWPQAHGQRQDGISGTHQMWG